MTRRFLAAALFLTGTLLGLALVREFPRLFEAMSREWDE